MINIHSKDNKMPQKKIFLHIGQHKTGSSSIQEALLYNQSLLAQHGFSLFNKNPSGRANKTGGAHRWIHEEKISGKFDNVGHIVSPDKLAKQLSKLPGNIIISAEGFFWIQDKNNLHKLKEELDLYFDEIYIVAYLRRQDEQIISHHQEEAKFNEVAFFGGENKALPAYQEHFDYYLDYEKKMLMWGGRIWSKKYYNSRV